MATEVFVPFYMISTGSEGRGLSVSSPEWLWVPLERWEELTGFLAQWYTVGKLVPTGFLA